MNLRPKLLRHAVAVFLLLSAFVFAPWAYSQDEKTGELLPAKKNSLSFLAGAYSIKAGATSVSSPGSLTVGYNYMLTRKWNVFVSYNNYLSTSGLSTSISGFDFGIHYCLFMCVPEVRRIGEVLTLTQSSPFGLRLGAGLSQRSFTLTSSTISFSGPYERLEGSYYVSPKLKALLVLQNGSLSNATVTMTFQSGMIGVGYDFGAGPVDWIGKIISIE